LEQQQNLERIRAEKFFKRTFKKNWVRAWITARVEFHIFLHYHFVNIVYHWTITIDVSQIVVWFLFFLLEIGFTRISFSLFIEC
jgi:hypothetical protein